MEMLNDGLETDDSFLDERVLAVSHDLIPLFIDYESYLICDVV